MEKSRVGGYRECVIKELMKSYKLDEFTAAKAVKRSYLSRALRKNADEVLHDPVEYWAELVYREEVLKEAKEM